MLNDRANAQRIARELIAEIGSVWPEADASRCVVQSGFHVFEFTLHPSRHSRLLVPTADEAVSPDSTVRFNPFPQATEIVLEVLSVTHALQRVKHITEAERDRYVRVTARTEILRMIQIAPDLFKDAIWQAQLIGGTSRAVENITPSGRFDIARRIVDSCSTAIIDRLKNHLPVVSKTRNLKISQSTIRTALEKFFPKFKRTGELPSQRQFAIAIGVTPKAWRTFLTKSGLHNHEITIKQWYDFMVRAESDNGGDFPPS